MRLSVLSQSLQESRRTIITWSLVLAGSAWLLLLAHLIFRPALAGTIPGWAAVLLGAPADAPAGLDDAGAWWRLSVLNFVLPLLMSVYAARQGSLLIAGEEERGSLVFLLAAPLARWRLVVEKYLALLLLILAPAAVVWLASALVGFSNLRTALGLFLLGVVFGGLAFAAGAITGRRQLSQNVVFGLILLTFLADRLSEHNLLGAILRALSPFSYYTALVTRDGVSAPLIVLLVLDAAAFALAWFAFERRDLPI